VATYHLEAMRTHQPFDAAIRERAYDMGGTLAALLMD
jgi:hypothetical protein